jgi:cytoskeletal protein RodZ
MRCNFTEKISSLIDGELAPAEAREVERHVLTCGECEQVKADFLSLRSQIAGFEVSLEPVVQNRELKKILSRGERVAARGMQWGWSTPAIAFATLLIAGAIIGFIFYQTSNTNQQTPQQTVAEVHTPSLVPSPEPSVEPSPEPSKEEKQPETPKETKNPERTPSERPRKPLVREPKPGEQFATVTEPAAPSTPDRVRSADVETLTAVHFAKSETLLVSFRNVRLNTRGTAAEVAYERKRAQQLVYQNMILRRQADANGDVHIASLLESLEPILLDIANLPDKPDNNKVRTIRERVERKNIVPLLQVNSAVLARALD